MRLFLTGATGVIGRRAVPALVAAGHEVTAVGRTPEKRAAIEQAGARAVAADLFDAEAVAAAVAGHDAVINLATAIPPASKAIRASAWRMNDRIRREASRNLVDAAVAAGASRYVQESFAPMYAGAGENWIDEGAPLDPAPHSRSTLDAEASARRFAEAGGAGVILRFGFFYGPDGSFAEDTIRAVRRGLAPTVGRPDDYLASIHHDDAGSAVVAALSVPAGTYNVVDDEPLRRREFYESLADALGVGRPKMPPSWLAGLTGSLGKTLSRSIRVSNRRFHEAAGWAPAYPSAREGWRAAVRALPVNVERR
jgi:nucleoside-diphosphate-sugar epimerase